MSVYCFGEVLLDKLPAGLQPGGAPLNVTYHLSKLHKQCQTVLISRIVNDPLGLRIHQLIKNWKIADKYLQIVNQHPASTVNQF